MKDHRSPLGLIGLASFGASLSILVTFRLFPSGTFAFWQLLSETDLGNALAALVAVGGYLLDHWNSRKAQQLEAQIQRVSSQSHELLVPITTQFHAFFMCSAAHFVDKHFNDEECSQADHNIDNVEAIFQQMGIESPRHFSNPSTFALIISEIFTEKQDDDFVRRRTTKKSELPEFIHKAVEGCKRPESKLWRSYEMFIRKEFLPGVQRIAEIIDENGHLMEPVPPNRLKEIFGSGNGYGQKWETCPRMWFYSMWLAYARAWECVVEMWDQGIYDEMRPYMYFPIGLLPFNIEAQTIVANVEKALVGMSQMHGHGKN